MSCLISQLPVPRCPLVRFPPLFYFSEAVISFCLLHAFFFPIHFAMSTRALQRDKQWANACPCSVQLHSKQTHVHALSPGHEQYFILLHRAQNHLHLWAIVGAKQSVRTKQTQWLLPSTTCHLYFIHFLLQYLQQKCPPLRVNKTCLLVIVRLIHSFMHCNGMDICFFFISFHPACVPPSWDEEVGVIFRSIKGNILLSRDSILTEKDYWTVSKSTVGDSVHCDVISKHKPLSFLC